jgi:hypothetical protein
MKLCVSVGSCLDFDRLKVIYGRNMKLHANRLVGNWVAGANVQKDDSDLLR